MNKGDIFLTRNTDEIGNNTPGYWNHCAIISCNDWVVEAQEKPGQVIAVPLDKFLERYPEIKIMRSKVNTDQLAVTAMAMVGLPYKKASALFPRLARGATCVSLLRRIMWSVSEKDPGWIFPDDIAEDTNLTEIKYILNNNWVAPNDWYEGMIKEPIYG